MVGDLADLVGDVPPTDYADPDAPDEAQVAGAAVDAITALLVDHMRVSDSERHLQERVADLEHRLERAYLRPTYRLREKVVRRLRGSRSGRVLLRTYRAARGRSSRSA